MVGSAVGQPFCSGANREHFKACGIPRIRPQPFGPHPILGHGANAPYGYKYEGRKKERRLVVQEDEAAIVRNMFIWYTQERLSVGQITDRLTNLPVPTPADRGRKVAQRQRGAGQWSKSSVARILR